MPNLASSLRAVRHWLKNTWISRLTLAGKPRKAAGPPRRKPRRELRVEQLEGILLPNDPFGFVTGSIIGGAILQQFGPIVTPAQVLLHGWDVNAPAGLRSAPRHEQDGSPTPASLLQRESADIFFTSLCADPQNSTQQHFEQAERSQAEMRRFEESNRLEQRRLADSLAVFRNLFAADTFFDAALGVFGDGADNSGSGAGAGAGASFEPVASLDAGAGSAAPDAGGGGRGSRRGRGRCRRWSRQLLSFPELRRLDLQSNPRARCQPGGPAHDCGRGRPRGHVRAARHVPGRPGSCRQRGPSLPVTQPVASEL